MKPETLKKIRACKALQGLTIMEVTNMPKFLDNLSAYMSAQREDRKAIKSSYEAMKRVGGAKGYKLPAHPIDRVIMMSAKDFAKEYGKIVVGGVSMRSAAEREYIRQLGQQAYNLTIAQIVCEEFPELQDELIPKSKAN